MKVWLPAVRAGSGADVFTERLAAAVRTQGIDAQITWFDPRYEFLPELLRLHAIPRGTDVIHANSWNAHAFLGRGVPVVTTVLHLVHDPAFAPYRSAAQALYHRLHVRWREALAIRRSAAVTAISRYVAGTVTDVFGRRDVDTIVNWVDTDQYSPVAMRERDDARCRLLMVGNHTRRKGADLMPRLLQALGARCELRCTGGLRDADQRLAGATWLGRLSEAALIDEYRQCDAVVSLSRYEGFGYTALEGAACGKPFAGFRTSGLAEVVADGETGFLEAIDDVDALAQRCLAFADDRARAVAMGVAARERALRCFAADEAAAAYAAVYRRVAGERL